MLTRIWSLVRKDLSQLRRDWALTLFIVLGPVSELLAVAWATSAGIAHLPTALVDLDHSPESRQVAQALANTETFDLLRWPETTADLAPLVDRGGVTVGVVVPPGFGAALAAPGGPPPQLQVVVDGSEPAAADAAIDAATGLAAHLGARLAAGDRSAGTSIGPAPPVDLRVSVRFNESLSEANYTLPSEAGFMLSAITILLASLGIARERELGTLEQLSVAPIRPVELIVGKALPAMVLSYMVFLIMLLISLQGFGVPMRGSWPLLLVLAAGYLFVELGWGIMASAISRTQLQALLLVFVFIMVEIVFSGYAFPVETMPRGLQWAANLFPIKHWLIVFRAILLKGAGPAVFWRELLALAGLGLGLMSASVLLLRRQRLV